MKVRNDFVSNSSSCSFIIKNETVKDALTFFKDVFANVEIPMTDTAVRLYVKNKWKKDVMNLLGKKDYCQSRYSIEHDVDPEEISWDSVSSTLEDLARGLPEEALDKINSVIFECDDYDTGTVNILAKLFSFFDRNGFKPSAEDSEHEFAVNDNEFYKLLDTFNR